jgi:2-amino-4-hydroxy-6-hydroxymethyldihydropteridine diphosphokinase
MARVSALMREWAEALGKDSHDVDRWAALGYLHDLLRGAESEDLRAHVPKDFQTLEGKVLHGPAAAARLSELGVDDRPLLDAVAFHTLGYAGFDQMGRALYAADFLEPARSFRARWRARLRDRMPDDVDAVVREILAARIGRLVERSMTIRPETVEFWNALVGARR